MIVIRILFVVVALTGLFVLSASAQNAEIFEPGKFSSEHIETSITFSSDGSEAYFTRRTGQWGKPGGGPSRIYYTKKANGVWSDPVIASFSGEFSDSGPHLTNDGKTMYFISRRPSDSSSDIWRVDNDKSGKWGKPRRLGGKINSPNREYSPKTDKYGNLYFASDRAGGFGQGDLYVAKRKSGKLTDPVNLGNVLNAPTGEWNLEVSYDGNTIIFEASGRPTNLSVPGDLYISFRKAGKWTVPQSLKEFNTTGSDLSAELVEKTGKLYFVSSKDLRGRTTDFFHTDFRTLLEKYRRSAKLPKRYLLSVNRSAHSVSIVNTGTGKVINTIAVGVGPHEISLSGNKKVAFVANYGVYPEPHEGPIESSQLKWVNTTQNTITRIDLPSLKTQTFSLPQTTAHHGILTNNEGSRVWVTAQDDAKVLELDGATGKILHEYKTEKGSHILKATPDFSKIITSNIGSNSVSVIDPKTREVSHIKMPKGPEGIGIAPDGTAAWILSNGANKATILDLNTLRVVKTIDTNGRFPAKLAFINGEAWIANVFSRNVAIFDQQTFEFKRHIELETTPLGIAASSNEVYVTLPRKNLVRVFDPATRKKLREFVPGIEPDGLAVFDDVNGIIEE